MSSDDTEPSVGPLPLHHIAPRATALDFALHHLAAPTSLHLSLLLLVFASIAFQFLCVCLHLLQPVLLACGLMVELTKAPPFLGPAIGRAREWSQELIQLQGPVPELRDTALCEDPIHRLLDSTGGITLGCGT